MVAHNNQIESGDILTFSKFLCALKIPQQRKQTRPHHIYGFGHESNLVQVFFNPIAASTRLPEVISSLIELVKINIEVKNVLS